MTDENCILFDAVLTGSRQCGICEQPATVACHQCRKGYLRPDAAKDHTADPSLYRPEDRYVNLCDVCSGQVHLRPGCRKHKPQKIQPCKRRMRHRLVADKLETMELFAVICIETSHYVSFVKCNASNDDDSTEEPQWCFFDSMADRVGKLNSVLSYSHAPKTAMGSVGYCTVQSTPSLIQVCMWDLD